jgi:hypothetical protein
MSKAEKEAVKKMKSSAYKSMRLGKLSKPTTKENKGALLRWTKEDWVNLTALLTDNQKKLPCGTKGKKQKEQNLPSVCRPSKKVSEKTPKPLAKDLSKAQIKKAVEIKKKKTNNRINWNKL